MSSVNLEKRDSESSTLMRLNVLYSSKKSDVQGTLRSSISGALVVDDRDKDFEVPLRTPRGTVENSVT